MTDRNEDFNIRLSRRRLLERGALAGAGLILVPSVLAACGSTNSGGGSGAASTAEGEVGDEDGGGDGTVADDIGSPACGDEPDANGSRAPPTASSGRGAGGGEFSHGFLPRRGAACGLARRAHARIPGH